MSRDQPAHDPWQNIFRSHAELDLVLLDGERWHCRVLDWSRDEVLVATDRGTILIPRHSIKYLIVEEQAEELLEEIAAEVPVLQEFLESEQAGSTVVDIDPASR